MRTALAANSDVQMLDVLQIGKDEMPDAIKTLQRALEMVVERGEVDGKGKWAAKLGEKMKKGTKKVNDDDIGREGDAWVKDSLHREFIESGIDALRRMSQSVEMDLPSWTITR